MNYFIIVFKNTHDAMSGERKLESLNVQFRIMPTPTTITQSCGICIRIEDGELITDIIENSRVEFKNIYERNTEGYKLVK